LGYRVQNSEVTGYSKIHAKRDPEKCPFIPYVPQNIPTEPFRRALWEAAEKEKIRLLKKKGKSSPGINVCGRPLYAGICPIHGLVRKSAEEIKKEKQARREEERKFWAGRRQYRRGGVIKKKFPRGFDKLKNLI
jgi:hypothetical protein